MSTLVGMYISDSACGVQLVMGQQRVVYAAQIPTLHEVPRTNIKQLVGKQLYRLIEYVL